MTRAQTQLHEFDIMIIMATVQPATQALFSGIYGLIIFFV
jgi:hypothetical protein